MDFTSHPLKTAVTAGTKTQTITPAVTAVERGTKFQEVDWLYEQLPDLVEDRLRAWYCKRFYALGRDRVLKYASQARNDGFDKRKLFSHLLVRGR